jgi:hypothetical protein
MNPTQLDQLRDQLRAETQDIHPVGLGVNTVRRRGRRRRNRAHAVVAVGAATCIAALGVSVIERGNGAPHQLAVAAQSGATATPALEFRVVDGTVANSTTHFTTAAGVTYELSTAPGTTGQGSVPGQAIYGTSDGEHWTTANQGAAWISDLTERDGVLYAIGTAPGSAAGDVRYRVGTSHDGGNAWSDTDLPFDLSAPNANVPLSGSAVVHLASGPTATVALLSEQFWPDLSALVAARTPGHPNATTVMTNDGYNIVDPGACMNAGQAPTAAGLAAAGQPIRLVKPHTLVKGAASPVAVQKVRPAAKCADGPVLGTISWSDIGLHGPGDLTRNQMLLSADGSHWDAVPAPTTGSVSNLVAANDGFLLLAQDNNPSGALQPPSVTTTLLHSTDAHVWTPVNTPAGLNVLAIAGDSIMGVNATGTDMQTSTDSGTTWNTTAISALLPAGTPASSLTASDVGPLGFAALITTDPNANNQTRGHDDLLFSVDGLDWTATDLATVGEPSTGYPTQVTVGADHLSVDYELGSPTPAGPATITTLLATPKG